MYGILKKFKEYKEKILKWTTRLLIFPLISIVILAFAFAHSYISVIAPILTPILKPEILLLINCSLILMLLNLLYLNSSDLPDYIERALEKTKNLNVFSEYSAAYDCFIRFAKERGMIYREARILQYSGANASKLIDILNKQYQSNLKLKILTAHPSELKDERQRHKCSEFQKFLQELQHKEALKDMPQYYKKQPSLAGILLDSSLLYLSWYTFETRRSEIANSTVWGHNNPHIVVTNDTCEGNILIEHFKAVFDNLWNDEMNEENKYI